MSELIHKTGIAAAFFLLPLAVACLYVPAFLSSPIYMTDPLVSSSDWYHMVHRASLAFHTWRIPFYSGDWSQIAVFCCIFAIGTCVVSIVGQTENENYPVWLFATVPLVTIAIAGFDIVLLSGLFGFTLLQVGFKQIFDASDFKNLLIGFLLSILAAVIAEQLAPLLFLLALALALDRRTSTSVEVLHWFGILLLAIPTCIVTWIATSPEFPGYPRVVHLHPLATAFGPLRPIDRDVIRSLWGAVSLALLGFVPLLAFTQRRALFGNASLNILLSLLLLLVMDTRFPENISQNAPIAGLERLLPDLYFIPLTPVLAVLALYLCVQHCSTNRGTATIAGLYALSIPLLSVLFSTGNFRYPLLLQSEKQVPEHCYNAAIATSPSYQLIVEKNLFFLCEIDSLRRLPLTEENAFVTTSLSNRKKRTKRMLDGSSSSRWHSRQGGKEQIQIELKSPVTLSGLQLLQGKWPGDFPEQVRISIAPSCATESGELIFQSAAKDEPMLAITPEGVPYAASSRQLSTLFPPREGVGCITIEQTGHSKRLWSITGIDLFIAVTPS